MDDWIIIKDKKKLKRFTKKYYYLLSEKNTKKLKVLDYKKMVGYTMPCHCYETKRTKYYELNKALRDARRYNAGGVVESNNGVFTIRRKTKWGVQKSDRQETLYMIQ